MSATDELRRLLDERGVKHYDGTESTLWLKDERGYRASADEVSNGMMQLHVWCFTPEQAIEATLGRGTCRRVMYKPTNTLVCSECGAGMPKQLDRYCYLHYCPNCGRKVVE